MSDLNNCFASAKGRLTVAEALDRFTAGISPVVGEEEVSLVEATHRILASDLTAEITVPPHDNSAVDGYAVYFDDLAANIETTLPVTGRI